MPFIFQKFYPALSFILQYILSFCSVEHPSLFLIKVHYIFFPFSYFRSIFGSILHSAEHFKLLLIWSNILLYNSLNFIFHIFSLLKMQSNYFLNSCRSFKMFLDLSRTSQTIRLYINYLAALLPLLPIVAQYDNFQPIRNLSIDTSGGKP